MRSFDGSLIENIPRFRDLLEEYGRSIEEKRRSLGNKLIEFLDLRRIEGRRGWWLKFLDRKRVVGVDGSQISPMRELGIPIGVVQVAKFWVIHGIGKYGVNYKTAFVGVEQSMDLVRFELEMNVLKEEMDGKSWLFIDGSLSPFPSDQRLRDSYISKTREIVEVSEDTKTPVVGHVDKSFSKDLAKSLGLDVYDVFLLSGIMEPFSYTRPFGDWIKYTYVSVYPTAPVRVEYPAWMEDMHDEVVRMVVAECLLGKTRGYPYVLERAHNYSCIDAKARTNFMKAIKSYSISMKWISKIR